MRRRDLLAGLAGATVVGGGGLYAALGPDPSTGGRDGRDTIVDGPVDVETIDARGSQAGTVRVPPAEGLLVIDFFHTTCKVCTEMKPEVVAAHGGTEVPFLSVTTEEGADQLRRYWEDIGGDWQLGVEGAQLFYAADIFAVPTLVAVGPSGTIHWRHTGRGSAEDIEAGIETARAAVA